MPKRKMTKAERQESDERIARTLENAERTRRLAERGQAKLDAQRARASRGFLRRVLRG